VRAYTEGGGSTLLDSLLKTPSRYGHDDLMLVQFLAPGYLSFLRDSTFDLPAAYADIVDHRRYAHGQRLWHAARYIIGAADNREFNAQPVRLWFQADSALFTGMRAEYLLRDRKTAVRAYQSFLALPGYKRMDGPIPDMFAEWRVRELSGVTKDGR
jgi:hypothetical protein